MIYEMLHFALRRSDARHFKLEDALMRESDSLFVTADRDEHQLELVEKIAKEVSASA
jgi:hemerythrin